MVPLYSFLGALPGRSTKAYCGYLAKGDDVVIDLMDVKSTGISIERFERIVKRQQYKITQRRFYLINPIHKYKFGVSARVQWKPIAAIPFCRNFVTTCVYYMIKPVGYLFLRLR